MDAMGDKAHELRDEATAVASEAGTRLSSALHTAGDKVADATPDAPATSTPTPPTTTTATPAATADAAAAAPPTLPGGPALGILESGAPTPPVEDVAAGSGVHGGSHAAALLGEAVSPSEAAADLSTPEAKEAKVRVNAAAKAALSKVAGGVSAAADGIASAAETVEAKAQDLSARADAKASDEAAAARSVSSKADGMAAEATASGEAVAVKAQEQADAFAAKVGGAVDAAGDKMEDAAKAVKETVSADVEVDRTESAAVPAGAQPVSISDAVAASEAAEEARKLS